MAGKVITWALAKHLLTKNEKDENICSAKEIDKKVDVGWCLLTEWCHSLNMNRCCWSSNHSDGVDCISSNCKGWEKSSDGRIFILLFLLWLLLWLLLWCLFKKAIVTDSCCPCVGPRTGAFWTLIWNFDTVTTGKSFPECARSYFTSGIRDEKIKTEIFGWISIFLCCGL